MSRPRWRRSTREPPPHRGGPRAWLASLVLNHTLKRNPPLFARLIASPAVALALSLCRFKISKTRPHVFSYHVCELSRETSLYLATRPTLQPLSRACGRADAQSHFPLTSHFEARHFYFHSKRAMAPAAISMRPTWLKGGVGVRVGVGAGVGQGLGLESRRPTFCSRFKKSGASAPTRPRRR